MPRSSMRGRSGCTIGAQEWTPTLAAGVANAAAALPPEGEHFAPWDGPGGAQEWTPTLAAGVANAAATLCPRPPEGEHFAPWDGPAALKNGPPRSRPGWPMRPLRRFPQSALRTPATAV